jgi:hypothetical protein
MRDLGRIGADGSGGGVSALPSFDEVRGWTRALGASGRGLDDADRIDLIRGASAPGRPVRSRRGR